MVLVLCMGTKCPPNTLEMKPYQRNTCTLTASNNDDWTAFFESFISSELSHISEFCWCISVHCYCCRCTCNIEIGLGIGCESSNDKLYAIKFLHFCKSRETNCMLTCENWDAITVLYGDRLSPESAGSHTRHGGYLHTHTGGCGSTGC